METNPLVTFLLPAWKSEWLQAAISSILSQSYREIELVVVDDCSPEDIKSVVDKFSDNRLRYYRNQKNLGGQSLTKQWDYCLTLAKGEWVVFAADDDVYDPDYVKKSIELSRVYTNVNIIRTRVRHINEEGIDLQGYDGELEPYLTQIDYARCYSIGQTFICMGNFLFRTSKLREIGFRDFPRALCSDISVSIEMASNGMACTNEALFAFRHSTVHISGSKLQLEAKLEAIRLFFDWIETYNFVVLRDGEQTVPNRIWHEKRLYDYLHHVFKQWPISQIYRVWQLPKLSLTERLAMSARWIKHKLLH